MPFTKVDALIAFVREWGAEAEPLVINEYLLMASTFGRRSIALDTQPSPTPSLGASLPLHRFTTVEM